MQIFFSLQHLHYGNGVLSPIIFLFLNPHRLHILYEKCSSTRTYAKCNCFLSFLSFILFQIGIKDLATADNFGDVILEWNRRQKKTRNRKLQTHSQIVIVLFMWLAVLEYIFLYIGRITVCKHFRFRFENKICPV